MKLDESNPSPRTGTKRNIILIAPSVTTSPSPTFHPTPLFYITNQPTISLAPTNFVSSAPSQTPEKPKIVREEETNDIAAVTCENAFPDDIQTLFSDSKFVVTDPPLTDIVVTYNYEAFIDNNVDKDAALSEMEYSMFFSVLSSSTWMMDGGVPTENCNDILRDALSLYTDGTRMLAGDDDWSYFLGWKIEPSDSFKDGATCATETTKEGSTCYPIVGKITAQVPIDREFSPVTIRTQVMSNIKSSVENDEFLSEKVLDMKFLGQTLDTNGFNGPTMPPQSPEKPNLLSAFGITAICALSLALVLIALVFGIMRKRKKNQDDFEKIQNDAIELGARSDDPETPNQARNVYTETSPDGVEVVDLDGGFGEVGASPVGDTNTVSSSSTGKRGFNLGSFMDSLRGGKDDLSYASGPSKYDDGRSLAEDSAMSVETEDYGNARGFRSDL